MKTLHHDVDVVLILKNVKQSDNVRVLAHLEDFDLTPLQLNVTDCHFFLRHNLDGHAFAGLFMDGGLYKTKLTFAERFLDVIEIEKITVSNNLLYGIHPSLFVFLCEKVVAADLVCGEDKLEGIQDSCTIQLLLHFIFDENANK